MSDKEDCENEINASNDCSPSSSPTQTDIEELRKKLKAPDNKKFERDLDKLNTAIRQKEAKFRSYPKSSRSQAENSSSSHAPKDRDTLMTELRGYKAEREKEIETRKKIDQDLKAASALVQSKTEACGKLQAGLKYKTESKVEEAIRRLEHQIGVQQLKLREEKRIVSEIDTLKRSKKLIHDFDFLKNEIGQLRDKQHLLRTKRDGCMRTIAGLKSKEEQVKIALDEQRHKADEARNQQKEYNTEKNALKKEIDDLYDKKRALVAAFNKEKDEYHNILRDIKFQERQIRREMELTTKPEDIDGHMQKSKQYKDIREQNMIISSHEKLLDQCYTLENYLKKLNVDTCMRPDHDPPTNQEQSQEELQGAIASFKGGTFLRKKNEDDLEGMYGGSTKKQNRRNSKKGRRSTQKENVPKKLVLHPLVLDQCLSLFITPPSTASDIPKTLELLSEKKAVLSAVLENPVKVSQDSQSSATSGTEDFPSLPSQNSVEETISTISSTDNSIVNNEEAKIMTEAKNVVVNDSEEQDQIHLPDQIKEIDESDRVLENRAENHKPSKVELKSLINGDVEQSDSHDLEEDLVSTLDNGMDNADPEQHTAEMNNIRGDEDESLKEFHINSDENLINESNKLKKNLQVNISDQNNAEYISNEIRNCASTADDNPKVCSKQALPQQIKEQNSERPIDCPS